MATFVALLRGVNVGKAKRVPMSELRTLLSGLGYTGVTTLLNSGNAVFHATTGTAARHAADIADAIFARLKVEVPVIVKSAREMSDIISENPIGVDATEQSRFLVTFVQDPKALKSIASIGSLVVAPERFIVGKHAAYLLCPAGVLKSMAWESLLGATGKSATTRNWATVVKLQALARDSDA